STQEEPIYLELTTEGFTDGGYLDERLKLASSILNDEVEKPNMLIFWYCQDSEEEIWQDEQSWYKSNPALGVVKKWSFLRGMVEDAKLSAATRAFVLAKDFNLKQNSSAAWLTADTILNVEKFDVEKLRGQFYIGGFDLSETTDLTAATAIFTDPTSTKRYVLSKYFVPEAKADAILNDSKNPEQKNYRQWAAEGLVTICPGNEVDTSMVSQWFFNLLTEYEAKPFKIGYDAWHAGDLRNELARLFGAEVLERIPMNFGSMSNAMSLLESDLKFKKLNYQDNQVTKWCLSNVAVKLNNLGQMMPVKAYGASKNRIDGAVALIISYAAFSRYRKEYLDLQRVIIK
ncbi:MAG: terminase large subunit, partial [Selenomonadaceae bacterium]|nr:terminase large subunit [Selenomonadaceae bacterium]